MSRHDRRATAARSRRDRMAEFSKAAGAGGFETSLCPVDELRPQDRHAIANWFLRKPIAKPTCFGCRANFSPALRPGGFLCATAIRAGPKGGIAVAGISSSCWTSKTAEAIKVLALSALHKNLGARGFAD